MREDVGVLLSPRLIPLHVLGAVATVAAVLLGFWQLQAWQAQREAAARDLTDMAPAPLTSVLRPDGGFPSSAVGRPVRVEGRWVPEGTFFATGRELDGRDGVWAVTPVAVCGAREADSAQADSADAAETGAAGCSEDPALLVVRGWAADADRAPAPPQGRVTLTGWLQPPEGSGQPDPDPSDDRLPEVRIADAIQRVDQDLYGGYLVADTASPDTGTDGLEPLSPEALPDPAGSAGLRNLLYAVEWWLFGTFAGFVWWRFGRDEVQRARSRP